jgi:ABC-2 type transport system permease protein
LKHWLIVFRGILLKGAGIQELWPELLAILVLGIIIYTFTIIILRRNKLE